MLRVVDVILELIREVRPIVEAIGRRDPSLARQVRDALSSVALNTAEGSDQRGARRTQHYAIACGSAREAHVALRAACAWGYIDAPSDAMNNRFNQVIGTLRKLA